MEIAKNIKYIGVDDMDIDLFEGQYEVPEGISYNNICLYINKESFKYVHFLFFLALS